MLNKTLHLYRLDISCTQIKEQQTTKRGNEMNNEMMLEMFMEIEIREKAVDLLKYIGKFDWLNTMSKSQDNRFHDKVKAYTSTVEKFLPRFTEEMQDSIASNKDRVLDLVIAHDENILNGRRDEQALKDIQFEIREYEYNLGELKDCIYR